MAAAYQSGSATDPSDLLNILATWLAAQGWTLDSNAAVGSGRRLHMHKGSDYVNVRSAINEAPWTGLSGSAHYGLDLYMGTGYSGAAAWDVQAGGPLKSGGTDRVGACMKLTAGAITAYHFFDDGNDNIAIVVERSGSLYTHMGFGRNFAKSGTWTGGAYFYGALPGAHGGSGTTTMGDASNHAGAPGGIIGQFNVSNATQLGHALFVRVDVDAFTGKWVACSGTNTTPNDGYTGKIGGTGLDYNTVQEIVPTDFPGYMRLVNNHLVSAFNAQPILLPVRVHAQKDAGGYSFIGEIPDVFACSGVGFGWAAASVQSINGKNYMAFPNFAVRKRA